MLLSMLITVPSTDVEAIARVMFPWVPHVLSVFTQLSYELVVVRSELPSFLFPTLVAAADAAADDHHDDHHDHDDNWYSGALSTPRATT